MRSKIVNIASHVAGWLVFFSLVIGFFANSPQEQDVVSKMFRPPFLIFYFTYLFLFYFNTSVLVPQFYLKKKYGLYIIAIILLFAAVYFLRPFDGIMKLSPPPEAGSRMMQPGHEAVNPGPGPHQLGKSVDITGIILFITVWSLGTAICIIRQWRITEQRALQAETDRATAELSFLKSQVNPHFLFNTLNNIYSLAVTNSENTATSIMKLSNIMRYITDEAGENFVPLDSEVECMRDYIDLQRLRLGAAMRVDFLVKGNMLDKKIAPLILMTFTENVFKYGTSSHEPADIIIRLTADEHNITFFCQNKLFEAKKNGERTGVGIPNARQRLQHLYPNKHFLDISTANGLFTVQLTLQA